MKKTDSGVKKKEWIIVPERRRAKRLNEENRIAITTISKGKKRSKGEIIYNLSENISVSGAKIRANILLPVDTILKIDFTVHPLYQEITAVGKVKWGKIIIEDKWYEAGVEFVDTSDKTIKKLEEYISWRIKDISLNPFDVPF